MVEEYSVGGALNQDDPTYVERDADDQLYKALKAGKFCYILTPRQTGKSSLRVRIIKRLNEESVACIPIDLSGNETTIKSETWYFNLISKIEQELDLDIDLEIWWQKDRLSSGLNKLSKFIEEILLSKIEKCIVIFIDEIDIVLSLNFSTDDFFTFIRYCYNQRGDKPQYKRLTFCLLGVASPNDLIKDRKRTPFNIGQSITLKPLQRDRVQPLINGLREKVSEPEMVMEKILFHTGGQPFLMQKLCKLIIDKSEKETSGSVNVDNVVNSMIDNWESQDDPPHFTTIRDRLLSNENKAFKLLNLYERVLLEGKIKANSSFEQIELKLAGLVLQENGFIKVYNPIYEKIFNLNWIKIERAKLRLYIEEFENWKKADDREKQLYLLTGQKLLEALKWKDKIERQGEDITGKESNFFDESEKFWKTAKESLPNECDYETIIKAMNFWTGGLKSFNDLIFDIARAENISYLEKKSEKRWVQDLVLSNLFRFREYQAIENRFLDYNDTTVDPFLLISSYREILQHEQVNFDGSPEHEKLADMCLIIKKDNTLRILNRIYRRIFNLAWIEQKLFETHPYARLFKAWEDSGCSNELLLLQEQNLEKAITWIQNREQVNELEVEFIIRSLVWEIWQSTKNSDIQQSKIEAVDIVKIFRPRLKQKTNSPDTLIQEILRWTRPEPLLLEELLKLVCSTQIDIVVDKDAVVWLKQLVRSHFIDNWENSIIEKHINFIKNGLTANQACESFWIMVKYCQLLQCEEVKFDDSREQQELLNLKLAYRNTNTNRLEVSNNIYRAIFSLYWISSQLREKKQQHAKILLVRSEKYYNNNNYIESQLADICTNVIKKIRLWISTNEDLSKKLMQNVFDATIVNDEQKLIKEIRILTYDIIKGEISRYPEEVIQSSLNRIFFKEAKIMAQDKLDTLLSSIVEESSAVEAIAIVNLEEGTLEYCNKQLKSSKPEIYKALFGRKDVSDALGEFGELKGILDALNTFGEATQYGTLEYSMFMLTEGIVIAYFMDLPDLRAAICFIATTEANFGQVVRQCRKKIDDIKKQLEDSMKN